MRLPILLPAILLCLFAAVSGTFAQSEEKRIERLSGLAKVWGAVKYFHPYPAYREIDWDKALIETIPKVNAAKSPEEYAAAVNSMLAALGDSQTRAFAAQTAKTENTAANGKESLRLENGILFYDALAAARISSQSNEKSREFSQNFFKLFEQAKAVVLDSRTGDETDEMTLYELGMQMRNILPALLDKKVTLGTIRYRIHNGYAPQDGATSGGYYSGLITDTPETFGDDEAKPFVTPPMVVIVDQNSPLAVIFSGLQTAGKAFIVAETGDLGVDAHTMKLADGVEVKMRTMEIVAPDGSIGFAPDALAPKGEAMNTAQKIALENKFVSTRQKNSAANIAQISQKDRTYSEMEFPEKEYRLLALFRFWNVINYFFPYKNLTGADWKDVLPKYIPQFEADKDAVEYRFTAGKMVAEIHDSHGFFRPPSLKSPPQFYLPPTVEGYAENQTYIRGVLDATSGFKVGDIVLEVDGVPIAKLLEEKFTVRVAASTPQAMMRQVHFYGIFRGAKDSKAVFKVRGLDGKIREVNAIRNVAANDPRFAQFDDGKRKMPVVSILPSGFGYVDLDRLQGNEVEQMFETIKTAPAVIFDMRGYPNGTAWAIAPRLSDKNQPIAALFDNPILEAKNLSSSDYSTGTNFTFAQQIPKREKGEIYKGKIVMLIDENAQSQSEHTCLFFEAARPDITFIGTPTAGANGDVTNLVLPGNIKVSFSGHGVRHADGRQLQRVGIQPNVKVAPTIKGLIEGKDEILDAAVKFLQSKH